MHDVRACAYLDPKYFNPLLTKFSSTKMMRSVSFVDRLELEFSGNHFAHALTIGDVDSDGVRTYSWLCGGKHTELGLLGGGARGGGSGSM